MGLIRAGLTVAHTRTNENQADLELEERYARACTAVSNTHEGPDAIGCALAAGYTVHSMMRSSSATLAQLNRKPRFAGSETDNARDCYG